MILRKFHWTGNIFLEYLFIVIPLIIGFTSYNWIAISLNIVEFIICLFSKSNSLNGRDHLRALNQPKPYFVTLYRSFMMLTTCIAILGVDFAIFPRRFAKVETYGISAMDLGVGCFVFSQGFVQRRQKANESFGKMILSSSPLIVLGIIRFFMTKASDYQEHITEYGTHWNFFFTLAFLPLLVHGIRKLIRIQDWMLSILIVGGYEFLLYCGLEEWILNSERVDFISSNREGIFSLFGYVGIYLLGSEFGNILLGPSRRSIADWHNQVQSLFIITVGLWILYGFFSAFLELQTSRRMANFMYVLCTLAFDITMIVSCLAAELFFPSLERSILLSAINWNQLLAFLVANLLTGIVNLSIQTLYVSDPIAFVILCTYTSIICYVIFICYNNAWTIKG